MNTDDQVQVKAIPQTETIEALKAKLKKAMLDYRLAFDHAYPAGANVQAYLRPGLSVKAMKVNSLADELRALDPEFPKDWVDLPEGR